MFVFLWQFFFVYKPLIVMELVAEKGNHLFTWQTLFLELISPSKTRTKSANTIWLHYLMVASLNCYITCNVLLTFISVWHVHIFIISRQMIRNASNLSALNRWFSIVFFFVALWRLDYKMQHQQGLQTVFFFE